MMKIKLYNTEAAVHPMGNATYTAAAAVALGQPVKFSAAGKVTPCTAAADIAIGVALDAAGAGEIVPVAILGNYAGTVPCLASGAVTLGAQVTAAGTATAAATDAIIGVALSAAAAGELFELAHEVAHIK